jgi:HAD superfamily hydrolase (TIGR01490 family)
MSRELALFDFDGTLSHRDSLLDFLHYSVGGAALLRGGLILSPTLFSHVLGRVANQPAKERVLTHFLAGRTRVELERLGARYALERLPGILRPRALERLEWHRRAGHTIAVVTASVDIWLRPWSDALGLDLLASTLEYVEGRATGRLDGANCHGEEKVRRIREGYALDRFNRIHAYGDTGGDRPMLALADEAHWRPFR